MPTLTYPHIEIDDQGVARFAGTRFKIIHVIMEKTVWKWSTESIREQHPELTLAQIHAALAYYYDHQAEMDARIEQDDQEYQDLREENQSSPIRSKLLEIRKRRQN